jgi:hypothetical protein
MFEFRRRDSAVLLAPRVKSGIKDTQLTADIRHGRPQFGLLESKDNLLFGES